MTTEKKEELINRIMAVSPSDKARFGQMNAGQMICHCTDQLRMAFGEIAGLKRQHVDMVKIREMALRNETLPTVDGLDQIAGEGTKPGELERDKQILVDYLNRFMESDENTEFSFHPYYDEIGKKQWERLVIYHLNHHLAQFGR